MYTYTEEYNLQIYLNHFIPEFLKWTLQSLNFDMSSNDIKALRVLRVLMADEQNYHESLYFFVSTSGQGY